MSHIPLSCLTYQLIETSQVWRKALRTWFHDVLWILSDGKCQNKGPCIVVRSTSLCTFPPFWLMHLCTPVLASPGSSLALGVLHRAGTPAQQGPWVLLQGQVPKIQMLQRKVLPAPFCLMDGTLRRRSQFPRYFSVLTIQAVLWSIGTSGAVVKEFLLRERGKLPHIYRGCHIKRLRVP